MYERKETSKSFRDTMVAAHKERSFVRESESDGVISIVIDNYSIDFEEKNGKVSPKEPVPTIAPMYLEAATLKAREYFEHKRQKAA